MPPRKKTSQTTPIPSYSIHGRIDGSHLDAIPIGLDRTLLAHSRAFLYRARMLENRRKLIVTLNKELNRQPPFKDIGLPEGTEVSIDSDYAFNCDPRNDETSLAMMALLCTGPVGDVPRQVAPGICVTRSLPIGRSSLILVGPDRFDHWMEMLDHTCLSRVIIRTPADLKVFRGSKQDQEMIIMVNSEVASEFFQIPRVKKIFWNRLIVEDSLNSQDRLEPVAQLPASFRAGFYWYLSPRPTEWLRRSNSQAWFESRGIVEPLPAPSGTSRGAASPLPAPSGTWPGLFYFQTDPQFLEFSMKDESERELHRFTPSSDPKARTLREATNCAHNLVIDSLTIGRQAKVAAACLRMEHQWDLQEVEYHLQHEVAKFNLSVFAANSSIVEQCQGVKPDVLDGLIKRMEEKSRVGIEKILKHHADVSKNLETSLEGFLKVLGCDYLDSKAKFDKIFSEVMGEIIDSQPSTTQGVKNIPYLVLYADETVEASDEKLGEIRSGLPRGYHLLKGTAKGVDIFSDKKEDYDIHLVIGVMEGVVVQGMTEKELKPFSFMIGGFDPHDQEPIRREDSEPYNPELVGPINQASQTSMRNQFSKGFRPKGGKRFQIEAYSLRSGFVLRSTADIPCLLEYQGLIVRGLIPEDLEIILG